jgi:hypothetical protein
MPKKKLVKKAPPKKKEAPKPVRREGEGPLKWFARYKKWMDTRDTKYVPKKVAPKKPKPSAKPKKKLTERQRRIKQRKEAETLLGIKRGIKKKSRKKKKK